MGLPMSSIFATNILVCCGVTVRKCLGSFLAAVIITALAYPLPVPAQDIEQIIIEPERETKAGKKTEKTAGEAEKRVVGETGHPVSFAEILADPDNIDLNFRYARQQVEGGDLKSAATTLERIVLMNPEMWQIRLFYGVVLFRLDSLDDAERELKKVADLNPEANVAPLLAQIEKRQKETRFTASLSMGFHYDTNRDAAPSSKQLLQSGVLTGTRGGNDDTAWRAIGNVSMTHDLGFQARHELIASLTYLQDEQTEADGLDLQYFSLEIGSILRMPWADITPSVAGTHMSLGRENFLRSATARLRIESEISPDLKLYARALGELQKFNSTRKNQGVLGNVGEWRIERTGYLWGVTLGGTYTINPSHRVSLNVTRQGKHAREGFHSYRRYLASAGHTWILGGGQFLLTRGTVGLYLYEAPRASVSTARRRDETYRLRLTYGAPLSFIGSLFAEDPLPGPVGDIIFTLTGEQFRSLSNLTNNTYRNSKLQTMLSKKWEF